MVAFSQMIARVAVLVAMSPFALASNFLAPTSLEAVAETADPELLHRLIKEVEDALGGSIHTDSPQQLGHIEELLYPTFTALPKNSFGKLDHPAVRYALHRLFVQMHGWVIRGFQSDSFSEDWNSSSATQLLQGRVPGLVQEIFETRIGEQGSSLHDIAVLASVLEHLIREEQHTKLRNVFEVSHLSVDSSIDATTATYIIELYMMFFIQGYTDLSVFDDDSIQLFRTHFSGMYPAWPETQVMLNQVQDEILVETDQFSFLHVAAVLREVSHRYYKQVHHTQCQHTKDLLLHMEDGNSGRVRLLDFYRSAVNDGNYQFTETIEYLRQIGSLDESDSRTPRLIIPNYVSGQSNCVARTDYYAVCCPDDCESRLDHLEHMLKRPQATPAEILSIVREKTDGVSDRMVGRLKAIAAHHGGVVPLHGRLFSQWMHFTFPRACVYPHLTGSTYTKTMEEWEEDTGLRSGSSVEEIMNWTRSLHEETHYADHSYSGEDAPDMWSMEEELVVERVGAVADIHEGGGEASSVGVNRLAIAKIAFLFVAFGVCLAYLSFGGLGGKTSKRVRTYSKNV